MFKGKFINNIEDPTIGLVYDSVLNIENENDNEIVEKINFEFWELPIDNGY